MGSPKRRPLAGEDEEGMGAGFSGRRREIDQDRIGAARFDLPGIVEAAIRPAEAHQKCAAVSGRELEHISDSR